ncbi:hypothetical protein SAMD00019534_113320 [Acytostelium subglobosum LB1]|uniref:hypothetical protein n=1 Tax=Acytostelium subglobosum LB1 TaxID=1410327 RepID=UPI0006452294|nr:hypothetical protein SAMD00019534_113320 [Acytostelium subglobosum LB1]GAM28156.1 hypothetical protein SAMD00019534_113320 [Acytostelium subglobosum LB1]|eukprot:XP_012748790.1 hypothetical protein SAMD00019534_113320 [Acytostelium subglobosum LB1]
MMIQEDDATTGTPPTTSTTASTTSTPTPSPKPLNLTLFGFIDYNKDGKKETSEPWAWGGQGTLTTEDGTVLSTFTSTNGKDGVKYTLYPGRYCLTLKYRNADYSRTSGQRQQVQHRQAQALLRPQQEHCPIWNLDRNGVQDPGEQSVVGGVGSLTKPDGTIVRNMLPVMY